MIDFMVIIMLAVPVIVAYYAVKKFGISDEEFARALYPDRFEKLDADEPM